MADDGRQFSQFLRFIKGSGYPTGRADAHCCPIAITSISRRFVGQEPAAEHAAETGIGIFPAPVAELSPQRPDIATVRSLPLHQSRRYGYSRHRIVGKAAGSGK